MSDLVGNPNCWFSHAQAHISLNFQMHWNNPLLRSDYKDSSGMNFYLTPNIRPYDAGVMMTGQSYLEIPPGQYSYSTDGGCPGTCTSGLMDGPVYVMEAFNHMHYLGEQYFKIRKICIINNKALNESIFKLDNATFSIQFCVIRHISHILEFIILPILGLIIMIMVYFR